MMIRMTLTVLYVSCTTNAFFNPLECCCGCRTSSCPPQGFGCPPPTNPCVYALFTLGRQITPCRNTGNVLPNGYPRQHKQQRIINSCRSPPCFILPEHVAANVIYNVMSYSNPQPVTPFSELSFQSVDANAGDGSTHQSVSSSLPSLNAPSRGEFFGGQQISIASLPQTTTTARSIQKGNKKAGNQQLSQLEELPVQQELPLAVSRPFQNQLHTTVTGIVKNASITGRPSASVQSSGPPPFLQSPAGNVEGKWAEGAILVPASSILIEASDHEPFTQSSTNEQPDPKVDVLRSADDDGYPEKFSINASERFHGDANIFMVVSKNMGQPTMDTSPLISTLQQEASHNNGSLTAYETISSDFGRGQDKKWNETPNVAQAVMSSPKFMSNFSHQATQTDQKSSTEAERKKVPSQVQSDSEIKMRAEGTTNGHTVGLNRVMNRTSHKDGSLARDTVTLKKRNDTNRQSLNDMPMSSESIQQVISKIRQTDTELIRIDNVLTEIHDVLTVVRREIELDKADTCELLKQSGRGRILDSDAEVRRGLIGYRTSSNQKKSNLTETANRMQAKGNNKFLNAGLGPFLRFTRASVQGLFEDLPASKDTDFITEQHANESNFYDDNFMNSKIKPTVRAAATDTDPANTTALSSLAASLLRNTMSAVNKPSRNIVESITAAQRTATTTLRSKIMTESVIEWNMDERNDMDTSVVKKEGVEHAERAEKKNEMGNIAINLTNNCNEHEIKQLIEENIDVNDASASKRKIQKAVESRFRGTFDVVCSHFEFSYSIKSDSYCDGGKGEIACLVFRQEYP